MTMTTEDTTLLRLLADEIATMPRDTPMSEMAGRLSEAMTDFAESHGKLALDPLITGIITVHGEAWPGFDRREGEDFEAAALGLTILALEWGIALGYRFAQAGGTL